MSDMSYSDAANILEAHNAWRRGQDDDTKTSPKWRPEDTRTLGVAIDVAVDGLRKADGYRAGLERARDALLLIWPTGVKCEHAHARTAFEEIEKALNAEGEQ